MKKIPYPWLVLSVTSLGVMLQALNLGTLNVALPDVASHFHAGPVATSWILLSYMLFNTVFILVFGKVADIYGRRGLYLFGLAEFTILSLFAGFAPNVYVLIGLRILQGIGGALVITNTTPLLTDAFSKKRLGTALSLNILIGSIAQLIGPVVGGYFVYALGWRWVFWFNVPIGILGFIWGLFILKPVPGLAKTDKVDFLGNTTVLFGLGGLILALSEVGVDGWSSLPVIGGLIVFIIFILLFIVVEKRATFPMIDFSLFKSRAYSMANLATFLNAIARSSVVLLIALFFQVANGENPFVAGLKVLPLTIGMIIGSPIVGYLNTKYSARLLSTAGLVMTCLGMGILITYIGPHASLFWISLGQLLIGMGTGVFQTPNTQSIMLTVPNNRRGVANGLRSMLQNMGQVISTALSLTIVTSVLPPSLKEALYHGDATSLTIHGITLIGYGYKLAFGVLLALTLVGVVSSYLRKPVRSQ